MGRIRSIHPGQWTDEDFVECGPWARLLSLGLRNEADDNGIFEWKPVGLKMRLFPADTVDMGKLLEELVQANQIMRFEIEGRAYGAIRNFRVYQSPKSPTAQHPITPEIRNYVGISASEDTPLRKGPGRPRKNTPVEDQSLSGGEFPDNGEINSGQEKSFPQKIENNSLMEGRGGERNNNNKHPTKETPRESEKPPEPTPPRSQPKPNPRFAAAIKAANMANFPSDLGEVLNEWDRDGIDFETTVLLAIRDAERENRESGRRPAFRMRFFDGKVRERHAESEREDAEWRKIAAQAKEPDHLPHPEDLIAAGKLKIGAAA